MSRLIFNSIALRNPSSNLCRKFIRNLYSENKPQLEQRAPRPEKIQITLCGRVDRPPINKPDGPTTFVVKTRSPIDDTYGIHRVLIFHETIKRIYGNRLKEGDQVYLNGSLKYFEFVTADEKVRQRANIVANVLHICDKLSDENDGLFDINDVKLIGQVINGPRNSEKATYLDVATRNFNRKEQTYQENRHSLIIIDENMRKIANTLDLGIDVCVNGKLHTRSEKSNDGKVIITVNISPYSLYAIQE